MSDAPDRYDAIVVGVGGMGSAALYHLARRGRRVLGVDRFEIPNEMGSSHGVTRMIRLAYHEDPAYVPLLRRAYELWHELEDTLGEQLLVTTGSVDAGPPGSRVFEGALRSCEEHGLTHELLDGLELARRFPAYRLSPETRVLLQPDGGFLLPERCIGGHAVLARAHGGEVHSHERLLDWEADAEGVRVRTDRGSYAADRLILSAGAWMDELMALPGPLVVPERQVVAWLQPSRPELFAPERFPVFNLVVEEGHYYGFPVYGVPGFKLGRYHHLEEVVDPDEVDRQPNARDQQVLREFAGRYFPDGAGPAAAMKVCLFENSPDEHFILDLHPASERVVVAAGFSGHGFKFCSVVGEVLADLALEGGTRHDIGFLRLARLEGASRSPAG